MVSFVGVIALTMLTLWIMLEGYRIMTGQSRSPLIGFVVNAGKAVMIVTIATSGALYNDWVVDTIDDFRDEVTYLITGSNQDVYRQVDKNLALTQTALSTISSLAKANSADTDAEASKAWWIGAFGGAGPAIIAGLVSLLNEIMMHFAILLGPLFILGLLFEQTKQLFWQWVKSLLGLMLSMGVLAFLSGLVLKITIGYATAVVAAIAVSNFPVMDGLVNTASITDTMMVQGGLGLLMVTLLITIPPAVSQFVGGTLGAGVSGFGPWGTQNSGGNPGKGQAKQTPNTNNTDTGGGAMSPHRDDLPRSPGGGGTSGFDGPSTGERGNAEAARTSASTMTAEQRADRKAEIEQIMADRGGYKPSETGNFYQPTSRLDGNNAGRIARANAGNYAFSNDKEMMALQSEYKKL